MRRTERFNWFGYKIAKKIMWNEDGINQLINKYVEIDLWVARWCD